AAPRSPRLLQKSPLTDIAARPDQANWPMLGLGWLIYFSFGMAVASLVPIITTLRTELDLSYTELGIVLGAWQLIFIGAAPPAGMLIDRFGPKRVLTVGALIIAASVTLRGFANGFPVLFAA